MNAILTEILAYAIPRNRQRGVTGLLLAHRGWFIHLLEGPQPAVLEAFQAICDDRRHRTPKIVIEGETSERMFPDWSLAAKSLSPADTAVLRGFDQAAWFDPNVLPERSLLRLLAIVGHAHERRFDMQQRTASPR